MSLSFPLAPTVAPGDPITSTQLVALAGAFNARLRSGIGDGPRRILYYGRNAFLSMVNPTGDVEWPQSHFLYQRQMVEPEHSAWPDGEPGFDNGANIAANWPAYIYGSEALDIYDEGTRLTDANFGGLPLDPGGSTPWHYWELGKRQRGAWDSETGAIASPAFTAARSYSSIRFRWWSPQGASFGGYFPTPTVSGTLCDDPVAGDDISAPVNYEIFFTNLTTAAVKTYDGTCQDGPDIGAPGMYDLHVYAIGYAPWAFYVLLNDGTIEELSTAEWVEGPYTGPPRLGRRWGNHFERFMNRFAGEMRGPEANEQAMRGRSTTGYRNAVNFGRLVRSQYLLAPARGIQSGTEIEAIYQTVTVPSVGTSSWISAQPGYGLAAFLVRGQAGQQPVTVTAYDGQAAVVASVAVGPGTTDATAVLHPTASALCFARSTPGPDTITVEVAELTTYTPGPWDVFLLMRVAAARL